jgi:hypothetical protein
MFRVRLVVTGDVETRALGPSLQRALRTVGADRQAVRFARSLFEDISAALEVANPLGAGATADCTYPSRAGRPETLTLRNL